MSKKLINLYIVVISSFLFGLLGPACRFEESCSTYTRRKITQEGVIKGTALGLVRILKCQPFYSGSLRKEVV